ncbi:MAG: response regulator [Magnetococcus sp. MYC-9]
MQTQEIIARLLGVALENKPLPDRLDDAVRLIAALPWPGLVLRPFVCLTDSAHHAPMRCTRPEAGACVCRAVVDTQQRILSMPSDSRQETGHLCVPILVGMHCLGVLTLCIDADYHPDADHEIVLVALAHALALMIERDRFATPQQTRGVGVATETDPVRGTVRVLLVEDNDLNQQMAREVLTDMGVQVWTASHGEEAVALAVRHPFDLVLMDLQMPVMDGYEATRRMRAHASLHNMPIIAMTAHLLDTTRRRCQEAGLNAQLAKPICRKSLYALLRTWIPHLASDTDIRYPGDTPGITPPHPLSPDPAPAVNMAECLERLGGNASALRSLLLAFRREHAESARHIRTLLDSAESQALERARHLTHALNGMAANLAAGELKTAAFALETAILDKEVARWPLLLDRFEQALQAVMASVDGLDGDRADDSGMPSATTGQEDALSLLGALAEAVYRQNFKAKQLLVPLRPLLVSREMQTAAEALEGCLARYDYRHARQHLASLARAFGLSLEEKKPR